MIRNRIFKGIYYSFGILDKYQNLQNFVSTKDVDADSILSNLNVSSENCIYAQQVHRGNIAVVDEKNKGKTINGVDALVTNTPNLCLCIRTADCLPLILFDPTKKALAVVHAGWKGTLKNISANTIKSMIDTFNIDARNVVAGIGPSIAADDYLVRFDVASKFIKEGHEEFLRGVPNRQWKLDLLGINVNQLKLAGIKERNIEIAKISTLNSKDLFSYRRGDAGQFITGGVICE